MLNNLSAEEIVTKLKAGTKMVPAKLKLNNNRIEISFGFNRPLMEEIKVMDGAKFHGYDDINPRKIWSIPDTERNRFQLAYLAYPLANDPRNPYFKYDLPLVEVKTERNLYNHQYDLVAAGLTYHYCILAAEMGTGKTLAAIVIMELSGVTDWFYVAPKSALVSVKKEWRKWNAKITPRWMTYEELKKILANWPEGKPPPQGLIYDESSRIKNKTAQRTQASQYLADQIRLNYGDKGFVIEMSGSPAPKSPVDWWSQCEIARPGFIREGNPEKFKKRLAIIEQRESFMGGGVYPHLVSWLDDERKCKTCAKFAEDPVHAASEGVDVFENNSECHKFEPSINEVAKLYRRMKGLVTVKFKKDCLSLPDKIYRVIRLKPSRTTLNAASAILAKSPSTVVANTLLRELSDGFQYIETETGSEICPLCKGSKTSTSMVDVTRGERRPTYEEYELGHWVEDGEKGNPLVLTEELGPCTKCNATGSIKSYSRRAEQVPCPKEDALLEILDEHDDVGRLVCYGGFTGTVDRICSIVQKASWKFIRVDGRGWFSDIEGNAERLLDVFQDEKEKYERVCFIGQPSSAGFGLTLTASPSICYYSNDFNFESRQQSEDRIHRPGMDVNRGATIIDLIHLPSDELVLANLQKKRKLQDMSLGEMRSTYHALQAELDKERDV